MVTPFKNPFRPGAGQFPPYLAGRESERLVFQKLLEQDVVCKSMILTGLRGTGKTVLLDTFKPLALQAGWFWVGTDLSESASVSEVKIAIRLLTDLSVVTSSVKIGQRSVTGFSDTIGEDVNLSYQVLINYFENQPGLVADRLKATLEWAWSILRNYNPRGIIFAYDEAQNISDWSDEKEYPLSVLLDVFQSLQRKDIPFLLLLVGLPTLFPKLVEVRTYSERMFEIVELKSLNAEESKEAITKPIQVSQCPVSFDDKSVDLIAKKSGGYPYFIQFMCREAFDSFLIQLNREAKDPSVPITEIIAKLDTEFFAGRWNNLTDRQRELLSVVASLNNSDAEFSIQEVVEKARPLLSRPIGSSQINQMFNKLATAGLLYRTRHGKYSLGIPLMNEYIARQKVLTV